MNRLYAVKLNEGRGNNLFSKAMYVGCMDYMAIVFIEQRSRKTAWMLLQSPFVLHVRTLRRINSILPAGCHRKPHDDRGNRCFFICFNCSCHSSMRISCWIKRLLTLLTYVNFHQLPTAP